MTSIENVTIANRVEKLRHRYVVDLKKKYSVNLVYEFMSLDLFRE